MFAVVRLLGRVLLEVVDVPLFEVELKKRNSVSGIALVNANKKCMERGIWDRDPLWRKVIKLTCSCQVD